MKNILVTGANGFVGKNLCAHLSLNDNINLMKYDINNTDEELKEMITKADFVFHFAGVNRPKNDSDFSKGNTDLTSIIVTLLKEDGNNTPLLISSSTQAEKDNAYGKSKKAAEDIVLEYGKSAKAYVYRFPNLFGKWCRPNYNSVVATFCYNISHDLPIQVNAPDAILTLAYIDDVVDECIRAMNDDVEYDDEFCKVRYSYQISLQDLSDMVYSFKDIRKTGVLPDMNDNLTRYMHTTYLSYLDEDNYGYNPTLHEDNRGWLFELLRHKNMGQIFVSKTKPGITRGDHYHHTKVEKFTVIQGEAIIRFRKIDGDKIIEYKVSGNNPEIVDIPPGYTHNISNIGNIDVLTLFWSSELYDPERPDTIYEKV